jgi:hypothetical protein
MGERQKGKKERKKLRLSGNEERSCSLSLSLSLIPKALKLASKLCAHMHNTKKPLENRKR